MADKLEELIGLARVQAKMISDDGFPAVGATLEDLAAEAESRINQLEAELDEARSLIPHPGDGSCDRCGAVPSVDIPTSLCPPCLEALTDCEKLEAALEAARLRFRPILMTAFSFILGMIPLVIAVGAASGSRRSLGTAVFGGMLAARTS